MSRFETSKICKSTSDLVVHQRTVRAMVLKAVDELAADVDGVAAYQLCTILMNAVRAKRYEIDDRVAVESGWMQGEL